MLTARSHLVRRIRSLSALLLVCFIILPFGRNASAAGQPSQSDVEAVYLFDFGKFVRWPEGADQGPLRICIAGSDAFAAALQKTVAELEAGGQPLERSIALYERGVALHERCAKLLAEAELKVQQLVTRAGGALEAIDVSPDSARETE